MPPTSGPRTPDNGAGAKRKRTDAADDSDSDDEATAAGIVAGFVETYLTKRPDGAFRLSCMRQLIEKVTGVQLHKQSSLLMRCITDYIPVEMLQASQVKARSLDKSLPAQYRVETRTNRIQDVRVFGIAIRKKPVPAWLTDSTHTKHALATRLQQSLKPEYRGADMLSCYTTIAEAPTSAAVNAPVARVTYPVLTPGPQTPGFHVTLVEGVFTQVQYAVTGRTVALWCKRVVREGSTLGSGTYPIHYSLPEAVDDQKPVACRALHVGMWEVKVPLAAHGAIEGQAVMSAEIEAQHQALMSTGPNADDIEVEDEEEEPPAQLVLGACDHL